MFRFFALLIVLSIPSISAAQVGFTSSNLPIVIIDTDSVTIPDEPKIPGRMSIIDNGAGERNEITDTPNDYDGFIGIEVRGRSSQSFPKKQYGIETRDASGENMNVPILGMPEENDWVLYAPYSDKSLMRNVLAYHLARSTDRYATRTRWCEVVLNGEYLGVFVMMEKVKRDDNRVDVNKLKPDETSGDDLTGGYVVQIGRGDESGWRSIRVPGSVNRAFYQYKEPDGDEIVPQQEAYIQDYIARFETTMLSESSDDPTDGYQSFIDVDSFIDYILVNEVSRNVDAYRLSTYLHKDKDSNNPLLRAGPVWDFNLGFGNVNYLGSEATEGFQFDTNTDNQDWQIRFWWPQLANEPRFRRRMQERWAELRSGPFHSDSLSTFIDSTAQVLGEAQERNFDRWPILGRYVWPNAFVGDTYEQEVGYLQAWLADRLDWLDASLALDTASEQAVARGAGVVGTAYPNPSRGVVYLPVTVGSSQRVSATVLDARGRRVATLHDGLIAATHDLRWNTSGHAPGVYLIRVRGEAFQSVRVVSIVGR